jgi:ATP phosphoribosyltransferase
MLRVAVPNKGALADSAAQMLREAGYRQRTDPKDLVCRDQPNDLEFFYLRPKDIATYVGSGDLDVGITGRATFRFAARPDDIDDVRELGGRRIATAYPGLVERHLVELGVKADVIRLDGAVENAIRLGVADVVADVVETGATLRQAGLVVFGEPLLHSSAVLVRRAGAASHPQAEQLLRRLHGVLVARRYVMLAYDVPAGLLDRASSLTPGIESPTVSPLHREGWVAVQAMVLRDDVHRIMDELYELGARAILVTNIHACRL